MHNEQHEIGAPQAAPTVVPEDDDVARSAERAARRARIMAGLTVGAFVVAAVGCADAPTPTLVSVV